MSSPSVDQLLLAHATQAARGFAASYRDCVARNRGGALEYLPTRARPPGVRHSGSPHAVLLDRTQSWLIHLEDENGDWFWTDRADLVPRFGSFETMRDRLAPLGVLGDEQYFQRAMEDPHGLGVDLDVIEEWLNARDVGRIDSRLWMNAWLLFDELVDSLGEPYRSGPLGPLVYTHLWLGNEAPANEVPPWLPEEVEELAAQLQWGLRLVRTRTVLIP